MIPNHYSTNDPTMKNTTFFLLLTIVLIIVTTLALPWYTQVVSVNDYFYSVSRVGAETAASLPVVVPLVFTLVIILVKPGKCFTAVKRRIIIVSGLIVSIYSGYFYCGKALALDTSPGFGALLAIVGGLVLVMICLLTSGKA